MTPFNVNDIAAILFVTFAVLGSIVFVALAAVYAFRPISTTAGLGKTFFIASLRIFFVVWFLVLVSLALLDLGQRIVALSELLQ